MVAKKQEESANILRRGLQKQKAFSIFDPSIL
jgi:hypothetical protein